MCPELPSPTLSPDWNRKMFWWEPPEHIRNFTGATFAPSGWYQWTDDGLVYLGDDNHNADGE